MGRVRVGLIVACCALGCAPEADWRDLPADLRGGIVVYGDTQTGHYVHGWLMDGIASLEPAAVLHSGDLVEDAGDPDEWRTFDEIVARLPSATPFYPARGNHERSHPEFIDRFDLPGGAAWYSVRLDPFHVLVLDSGADHAPGSEQYAWAEQELAGPAQEARFIVAVFHHPPYSTGAQPEDAAGMRADVVPLLEAHGVDLVFSGHDHDYERSRVGPVRYVVTGGGGARLGTQERSRSFSEAFASAHHFCVLQAGPDGGARVEVWDWTVERMDRFTIQ